MRIALKIAACLWGAIGFTGLLVYLNARSDLGLWSLLLPPKVLGDVGVAMGLTNAALGPPHLTPLGILAFYGAPVVAACAWLLLSRRRRTPSTPAERDPQPPADPA